MVGRPCSMCWRLKVAVCVVDVAVWPCVRVMGHESESERCGLGVVCWRWFAWWWVAVVLVWCAGQVWMVCVLVTSEGVDVGVWKGKAVVGVVWTWLCEGRRELFGIVGLWFAGCVACVLARLRCVLCGEAVCLGTISVLRAVVRSGLDCSTCPR